MKKRIEDPDLSPVLSSCGLGEWAIECFKYFTEKFPSLLKSEEFKNRYLLDAAKERQFGLMEALLDAGADINAVDKHGNTPLLGFASACRLPIGHPFPKETAFVDCMRSLIEKGADPLYKRRVHEGCMHRIRRRQFVACHPRRYAVRAGKKNRVWV